MKTVNNDAIHDLIRLVAKDEILPRFRHLDPSDISYKGVNNPVTIADKKAEKRLAAGLKDLLPGSNVVGEEAFAADRGIIDHFADDSPVWTVDPIDGTKNFIAGRRQVGVIVSLSRRDETVAGWLYDPFSDEFIEAEKGAGAFHKGERVRVLPSQSLDRMRGSPGQEIMERLGDPHLAQKSLAQASPMFMGMIGCLCHEYARLLVGSPAFSSPDPQWHFHSTLTYCTPWDNAAGILIHREAGGYNAHWDGAPFTPATFGRGVLLAPDPDSWQQIRRWVQDFCTLPKPPKQAAGAR